MIRKFIKIGSAITSSIVTIILFIFGESWLIASIYYIGPIRSFIFFDVIFTFICFTIIYLYYKEEKSGNKIIYKIETWIEKKENNLSGLKLKLLKYGKLLGLLFLGITAGPLPTSIFIGVLGYQKRHTYIISAFINVLFFLIWISIYSGGIELIKIIIK